MKDLTPFEKDALGELLNIAMGMTASSLSEISGNEVSMTIPNVELVPWSKYKETMGDNTDDNLISVSEAFSGGFSGEAVLIFFVDKSMDLVRSMIGDLDYKDEFTDMEEEVLTEIGNILLNSCIAAFSNTLMKEFQTELPKFNRGPLEKLLPGINSDNDANSNEKFILLAQIGFSVQDKEIKGQLALILTLSAVRSLIDELNMACSIAI